MNHAELRIVIENELHEIDGKPAAKAIMDLEGCPNCLANTISRLMLEDPNFKLIIKEAVRLANIETDRIKKSQQN